VKTQRRLQTLDDDSWEALYRHAASTGHGQIVEPEEERLAATDELLAAALPALTRLGGRLLAAALCVCDARTNVCCPRESASILRLLDCALAAHGRDHGYVVDAWRSTAVTTAWVIGDDPDVPSPAALMDEVTEQIAAVFVALPRDRLGISEQLAEAIGRMLVVYAVTGGLH
jgi:hypothetical protein